MKDPMAKWISRFALTLLVFFSFVSTANAIKVKSADVQDGVVYVQGSDGTRLSSIVWEGGVVTQVNPNGGFSFNGAIPTDCIGTLSDGVDTIEVAVSFCTPTPSAPVPQTGQTICYDLNATPINCGSTGQDGESKTGVVLPTPRFTDHSNGTFTANLTGLIWLKDAGCVGLSLWTEALNFVKGLEGGICDLADGSASGQWRLPNIRELHSLINFGFGGPALSKANGIEQCRIWPENTCPFDRLWLGENIYYWSSTSNPGPFVFGPTIAYAVDFNSGAVSYLLLGPDIFNELPRGYVMAVRGP